MIHSSPFYDTAKISKNVIDQLSTFLTQIEQNSKKWYLEKLTKVILILWPNQPAWDRLRKKACKLKLKSLKPSWHYFTSDMYDIFCSPFWLLECELSDFKRHFRQLLTSRLSPEKLLPPVKLVNLSKAYHYIYLFIKNQLNSSLVSYISVLHNFGFGKVSPAKQL